MARITDISPQKRNKERVNLYLDGKFFCGADALTVLKARLKPDSEIEEGALRQIIVDSESATAFDLSLKYISGRLKTEKEVRKYLSDKGFIDEIIDRAADKLKEYSYIDNGYYATSFISHRSKSTGRRKMEYDLVRRGVDREDIDNALSGYSEAEELENAKRIAEKYMRSKDCTRENKSKLYRHLAGKGFSSDISVAVIRTLGGEDED